MFHPVEKDRVSRSDRPWIAHYDPGVPASIEYPDHTLHAFLVASASMYPDRACTILGDAVTTYGEMNTITDSIAPYKVPTLIAFCPQLSRSKVGKVIRRELVRAHRGSAAART
jgi:non-ribosomal peptide synthetase component E (peptide arylation enzyme)